MIAAALFLTLGVLVASDPQIIYHEVDAPLLFRKFQVDYNKEYSAEDEVNRFNIFKSNLKKINDLNAQTEIATFGITKYADMTMEEFRAAKNCFGNTTRLGSYDQACTINEIVTNDAPASWDWRERGAVTRVKSQESCGACWAFSTIGNVEGIYAIKHQNLLEFSEQQVVDCTTTAQGCQGGWMDDAMKYLASAGGSLEEQDYPYEAAAGQCKFDPTKVQAKVEDCAGFMTDDVEKLKESLYTTGPLSMVLNADTFGNYQSGILTESQCPKAAVNHAVLLVGYGTENDVPYWIIKNSWGSEFGENGYIRLIRQNGQNPCNMYAYNMVSVQLA